MAIFSTEKYTRGSGLLEPLLARARARRADRLILPQQRKGRILDIGCGSYPYFLSHTSFKEKFALDKHPPAAGIASIEWHQLDLNSEPKLPFKGEYFQVITLLAVVEHLNPASLVSLFKEAHRALSPGGSLILTTPAAWSDRILKGMARVNLVSEEEIHEHVYAYTLPLLGWYFGKAGFSMDKVEFGYFEFWLNLWAKATK
jgi:SAM-dependent methyltransferase